MRDGRRVNSLENNREEDIARRCYKKGAAKGARPKGQHFPGNLIKVRDEERRGEVMQEEEEEGGGEAGEGGEGGEREEGEGEGEEEEEEEGDYNKKLPSKAIQTKCCMKYYEKYKRMNVATERAEEFRSAFPVSRSASKSVGRKEGPVGEGSWTEWALEGSSPSVTR
ncbi:hypothetical protein HZH68_012610 [Vespula germanica]|uniref:Uncharacterized protein n=1 Tax=Vespula germanica TaxID=30212 RepID=A0A834MZI7_VESGE|nr:hypothetical protein HZH68_012610 [Vespula germanica]